MSEKTRIHNNDEKVAAVLVRGLIGIKRGIHDTLIMLNLKKRSHCVIYKKTQSIIGMVKKCKDFITWGEITPETEKLLIEKRGEKIKDKDGKEKIKNIFRLNPPKKGFGRKGVKVPFSVGGAVGYRGEKINDLIKRMI